MSINPLTRSQTAITTKSLQLNALDAKALVLFYQDKIGLTLLGQDDSEGSFKLGTPDGDVLLEIFQTDKPRENRSTGLYHMAFLMPTRKALADILMHLVNNQVGMTGASDHGYSEALYLDDPEGNGIEIYWDKPEDKWDIKEDGTIAGIVIRLDLNDLTSLAGGSFNGMPSGTTLGHMHIHVGDIGETWAFYRDKLGLGFKYPMGKQAIFMATGDYHHHLGANIWQGTNLPGPAEGVQGLKSYTWQASAKDYDWIKSRLRDTAVAYSEDDEHLWFKDNSGLTVGIAKTA